MEYLLRKNWKDQQTVSQNDILVGSFRLDYEYEIEYEYDFRISNHWHFQSPRSFMLFLGRESGSWDELGMCCENVKPEN